MDLIFRDTVLAEHLIEFVDLSDFQFRKSGDGTGIHGINQRTQFGHFMYFYYEPHSIFARTNRLLQSRDQILFARGLTSQS